MGSEVKLSPASLITGVPHSPWSSRTLTLTCLCQAPSLTSSAAVLFPWTHFLLEELVTSLNCSVTELPLSPTLLQPRTHPTCFSLCPPISRDTTDSWILAQVLGHVTTTPSCFLCLLHHPTSLLLVSDTQAAKRSGGKITKSRRYVPIKIHSFQSQHY